MKKWIGICVVFLWILYVPLCVAKGEALELPEELQNLYARSAVLMDGSTGRILYGKNETDILPMASTTKIMTCILALENGSLSDVVTVSANAAAQPAVKLGMSSGEQFALGDLLYSLMLESHNDSAVAIAEHIGGSVEGFAHMMNQKAKELGCTATYYITPNGLDATDENGTHSTTAGELARVMGYCTMESPKKEEFLEITRRASYSFSNGAGSRTFSSSNHNAFLSMMEGALSGKTGFTGNAGYCYVGALKRDDKVFIVALLACGWPNNKTYKWSDTRKLMEYGLNNYEYKDIEIGEAPGVFEASKVLTPRPVLNGIAQSQNLSEEADVVVKMNVEPGEKLHLLLGPGEEISAKWELEESLAAPVAKGERVGQVMYMLGDRILKKIDIVTAGEIEEISYRWCLQKILEQFFITKEIQNKSI